MGATWSSSSSSSGASSCACWPPEGFFQRPLQTQILSALMQSNPKLLVLLGAPYSGKTELLRYVVRQTKADGSSLFDFQWKTLLREDVANRRSFLDAMNDCIQYLSDENIAGIRTPGAGMQDTTVAGDRKMKAVMNALARGFSVQDMRPRPAVLVLDDAHELKTLAENDKRAFRIFIDFVECISNLQAKVHVVLLTNDPLFVQWLYRQQVDAIFLTLDDLSKMEARDYYHHLVASLDQSQQRLFRMDESAFDDIFRWTGGRIFWLDVFVQDTIAYNRTIESESEFLRITRAKEFLLSAVARLDTDRQAILRGLRMIAERPSGTVFEEELRGALEDTDGKKIEQLVSCKLIYLRPSFALPCGVQPFKRANVFSGMSGPLVCAMKAVRGTDSIGETHPFK